MENPRVNILICNHNYEEWINDAIDSAIAQTYPNIMITIVDDGSTDKSWNKVYKTYFKSRSYNKVLNIPYDTRVMEYKSHNRSIPITLIKLDKNYGPSYARNIGISVTIDHSDFFLILDADDKIMKNKVWRCVEEAMKMPNIIGIVYGDYLTHNTETGLERIEYKHNYDRLMLERECIIHSGSLISKQSLIDIQDNGYYDNSLRVCEDYDLWLRITRNRIAIHVPEVLSFVRVTPKNSTNQVDKNIWQECMNRVVQKNLV